MRRNGLRLGEDDRRAMAGGAATGFGLMALLALRADWLIVSGIRALHEAGQAGAAATVGFDLLPWMLLLTGLSLAGALAAFGAAFQTRRPSGAKPRADAAPCEKAPRYRPHFAGR